MRKQRTPMPKADPRGYEHLQGEPMDVNNHPSKNFDAPYDQGTSTFRDITSALGPKASYAAETAQMNTSVGISDRVPRDQE